MSNNQNLNNLGDQIKGALSEALVTGDFKNLNNMISDTVTSALNDAGITTGKAWQQKEAWKNQKHTSNYSPEYWSQQRMARLQAQQQSRQAMRNAAQARQAVARNTLTVPVKNVGLGWGITGIVLGSCALVPFLVFFILASVGVLGSVPVWGLLLFLAIAMIVAGAKDVSMITRAKRYVRLCGNKLYATMEELAAGTGESVRQVRKDIKKILRKGILPTARVDLKATTLMLNDIVFQQYLKSQQARTEQAAAAVKPQESKTPSQLVNEARSKQQAELQTMVNEGHEYIKKLRELNDVIEGEVISNKLYQLENILKEIFARVEKEPDQMHRMKKVMEYYLPTTLKLVEAYRDYDSISAPGTEVISAMAEIEKTLDSINMAFEQLLNSLFQDSIFDVTTDAQVLQTMLAREGLTKELELEPVPVMSNTDNDV
ncbi:MAG: 5-bromo-4-chloroindolyl phosphate hydrolysis family protein [Lachnospiraceae bacterium]|nr:5-bromo-4-chloroindolyl phosphate hydrolysis family protein [Lachnospiraceae bacterium]